MLRTDKYILVKKNYEINNFEDVVIQAAVQNVTNAGDGWGFRKIFLWATERRLKQFSKPLLREFAVLRLLGVLSPMEIWRKPHPSPAHIAFRPAA